MSQYESTFLVGVLQGNLTVLSILSTYLADPVKISP